MKSCTKNSVPPLIKLKRNVDGAKVGGGEEVTVPITPRVMGRRSWGRRGDGEWGKKGDTLTFFPTAQYTSSFFFLSLSLSLSLSYVIFHREREREKGHEGLLT